MAYEDNLGGHPRSDRVTNVEHNVDAVAKRVVNVDGSGDIINDDNPLPVEIPPCICTENSTSTPLDADDVFTGTAVLTNGYGIIYVNVYADKASATDGLVIEQSTDGTNWDFSDVYTIPASTGKTFSVQPAGRYMRVVYTNGAADQTEFRLQTIMKNNGLDSSHRVQDTLNDDDDGRLRLSVLKLRTAQNSYVSGAATNSGNFKTSIEEYDDAVNPIRSNMEGGGKVSVGTTAVEATFTGATKTIIISADSDNAGTLYLGKSNVTSAGANAICFLNAGERFVFDYNDNTNAVYVVASEASQNFWKGALI